MKRTGVRESFTRRATRRVIAFEVPLTIAVPLGSAVAGYQVAAASPTAVVASVASGALGLSITTAVLNYLRRWSEEGVEPIVRVRYAKDSEWPPPAYPVVSVWVSNPSAKPFGIAHVGFSQTDGDLGAAPLPDDL